jgi:hypothetical protein
MLAYACERWSGSRISGYQGVGGRYDQRHLGTRTLEGYANLPPECRHAASEHQDWGSPIEYLLPAAARAGGAAPSPVYSGAQASSIGDVVDSVPWTLLTSPKRDFGDGGGSNDRGAPINKLIQCHRHCKEHGGERFDPITPSCSPSGGAHGKCI